MTRRSIKNPAPLLIPALILTTLCTLFAGEAHALFGLFEDKYTAVTPKDGVISIPVNSVNDGKAHYFKYVEDNNEIRFFVLKSRDNVLRAAFDACDVCYHEKKGYRQEGDFMICNNCGQKFHSTRINLVKGGCNPAPLRRAEKDGQLLIAAADVKAGARYF